MLESSFGAGYARYYMGPGDNSYKLRWTDQGSPVRSLIVYNRTLHGRREWFLNTVAKPMARSITDRFRKRTDNASTEGDSASGP